MTQKPAFYQVMYGLPGCMPDSSYVQRFDTRRDMVSDITESLEFYGWPARARRVVDLVETWRYIQRGGKKANFTFKPGMGMNACILEYVQISQSDYYARLEEELA